MRHPLSRLACCLLALSAPVAAQTTPLALTGTLVTPGEVIPGGTVLIQNGRIIASGAHVSLPAGTKAVDTGGIIAPGLIDLHNHLTYNIFPRWKPIVEFDNRYDWQQKPVYNVLISAPHAALVEKGVECMALRYAEIKAIIQGETSVTGSMRTPCIFAEPNADATISLSRNLDLDPGLGPGLGKVIYDVFPLQMPPDALALATTALSARARGSLLIHIAEGAPNDASAAREFTMLKARGLLRPGVTLIHGVALKPADFAEMAAHGVGLIWSPRSNLELYGDTANVAAAKAAGVTIALAPDWSPTGSDGLLSELNYASVWNRAQKPPPFTDRELFLMATANAAKLVNLAPQIGSLAAGSAADLIVVRLGGPEAAPDNPYWTLTHAIPEDLDLVLVAGTAVYGNEPLMRTLSTGLTEKLTICQASKTFASGYRPLSDEVANLGSDLRTHSRSLAPLAECGQ